MTEPNHEDHEDEVDEVLHEVSSWVSVVFNVVRALPKASWAQAGPVKVGDVCPE